MQLQVLGYEDKVEGGSKFTAYITTVEDDGHTWDVPIRYSRFHEFFGQITKTDKHVTALAFPQKVLFTPSNATRQRQLHDFMMQLADAVPTLSEDGRALVMELLEFEANALPEVHDASSSPSGSDSQIDEQANAVIEGNQDGVVDAPVPVPTPPVVKRVKKTKKVKKEAPPAVRAAAITYTMMVSPVMLFVTVVQTFLWLAGMFVSSPAKPKAVVSAA
ncbi:hypothetical protein ACHHYP_20751 [Achlya hypogyna]|uniref:PX domain-containing protein n=1 Tax=Achlya hypogyna TaxID=1202772 RepID=A0A1V9YC59_ACHHY|nr:hypothetical protein ACHHYP_20751 [Achlya hypogyna]